jgi:hypothetical protein
MSLNDPIYEFLQSRGKLNSKINFNVSSKMVEEMRHTLLWRQDPEESFSDWKIILVSDDANVDDNTEKDSVLTKIQSDTARTGEQVGNDQKKDTASINDKDDNDTEAAPLTKTFYVHQNILASVSTYFRSLLKKGKHSQTSEHQTQTSTIKLHPKAIESFPIFLDYVYNSIVGQFGFERSNAVALRHLALYFGVDALLKDITELILLDFRSAPLDDYYNHATLFNDEKLLQGVRLQHSISEALLAVVPGFYGMISERPEVFLQKKDNSVLSSYGHIMKHICDTHDAFFTLKNAEKFPDITVTGAGLDQVNGIYNLFGESCEVGAYTNGICTIWKEKHEGKISWNFDFLGFILLYSNPSDTDYPPSTGWTVFKTKYSPAPIIISKKAE